MQMKSLKLMIALGFALGASGCGQSSDTAAQPQAAGTPGTQYVASDAKGIQTMTVKTSVIPEYLDLAAHIEPDPTRVVHVFPAAGGRIVEMKVRPWDRVEKGQTLARIESSDLSRAVADFQKASVDFRVKQKALERAQDLLEHRAIAEKDFQQAQGDAAMAQSELDTARQHLQVIGVDPEHLTTELRVVAPRSGVVLDIGAAPGEFSKSLDAPLPLCTIADISSVWAVGDIYEKDLAGAKTGQEAQVTLNAYPDQHWSGRVGVVSDAVDPTTRTLRVRVVLPNPGERIKPAMFGSIRLLRSSSNGILLPASAVVREGNNAFVFVGKGNGRFEKRSVMLGRTVDGSIEIASGISAGDTIISEGALLLRAGAQG
jgi:cobalt-zinc-cadmium efflux system membrane fusion protein